MTIVNVRLTGELENFVENFIRSGYATSKTEVIRMGLIKLKEQEFDDVSDDLELGQYLRGIRGGKVKPKFLKPVSNARDLLK